MKMNLKKKIEKIITYLTHICDDDGCLILHKRCSVCGRQRERWFTFWWYLGLEDLT